MQIFKMINMKLMCQHGKVFMKHEVKIAEPKIVSVL